MRFKSKKGFTLIELIVTISIMATLAAFAIPSFMEAIAKAKVSKSMDNMVTIASAVGQKYHELHADYSYVNIVANTDTTEIMVTDSIITYTEGGTQKFITFENIFPGGFPVSPFDGRAYRYKSIAGIIDYALSGTGRTKIIVTARPGLYLDDQEDKQGMRFYTIY